MSSLSEPLALTFFVLTLLPLLVFELLVLLITDSLLLSVTSLLLLLLALLPLMLDKVHVLLLFFTLSSESVLSRVVSLPGWLLWRHSPGTAGQSLLDLSMMLMVHTDLG